MFTPERAFCAHVLGIPQRALPPIRQSYTLLSCVQLGEWLVNLGILTRIFRNTYRSALHEMIHLLLDQHHLYSWYAFGSDWTDPQRPSRYVTHGRYYVTRYAATHPEEDFVETTVAVLMNDPIPSWYARRERVVRGWLTSLRRRNW